LINDHIEFHKPQGSCQQGLAEILTKITCKPSWQVSQWGGNVKSETAIHRALLSLKHVVARNDQDLEIWVNHRVMMKPMSPPSSHRRPLRAMDPTTWFEFPDLAHEGLPVGLCMG
jgi:hypothetical protein